MKDIGTVELGSEYYNAHASYNGRPCSGLAVRLSSGANALDTAKRVKAEIDKLKPYFPESPRLEYFPTIPAFYALDQLPFDQFFGKIRVMMHYAAGVSADGRDFSGELFWNPSSLWFV